MLNWPSGESRGQPSFCIRVGPSVAPAAWGETLSTRAVIRGDRVSHMVTLDGLPALPKDAAITTLARIPLRRTPMARNNYGLINFAIDVILCLLTGGLWLIWIFVREMRRR